MQRPSGRLRGVLSLFVIAAVCGCQAVSLEELQMSRLLLQQHQQGQPGPQQHHQHAPRHALTMLMTMLNIFAELSISDPAKQKDWCVHGQQMVLQQQPAEGAAWAAWVGCSHRRDETVALTEACCLQQVEPYGAHRHHSKGGGDLLEFSSLPRVRNPDKNEQGLVAPGREGMHWSSKPEHGKRMA